MPISPSAVLKNEGRRGRLVEHLLARTLGRRGKLLHFVHDAGANSAPRKTLRLELSQTLLGWNEEDMYKMKLAFVAGLLGTLMLPAAASACNTLPGVWAWVPEPTVARFYPSGRIVHGRDAGKWACGNNRVKIYWNSGYVDTLSLSGSGLYLTGHNNNGGELNLRRVGD